MKLKNSLVFLAFILSYNISSAYTVLVDPGHGGEDIGAIGYITKTNSKGKKYRARVEEKDLALQISKEIYRELKNKRYKVFLTRSFDRKVTLIERAEIAEKVQADLFISVHLNSARSRKANGFETYYLDNHTDAAVNKVEAIENNALKGDELIVQQILIDLVVERTAKTSKNLANLIHSNLQKKMVKKFSVRDRHIKPGVFYVLALSKRPAVLLEAGFMSNKKELKKLMDPKFQKMYAKSVVEGIDQYMREKHKNNPSLF